MNYVDEKYINLCCSGFRNFKRKSGNLFNFSCPLCGDSDRDKRKARGFFYKKGAKYHYFCHNCSKGFSLPQFLKEVNHELYQQYCFESFSNVREEINNSIFDTKPPKFTNLEIFKNLQKISELSTNNPIKKFVEERKIPKTYYSKFYACPNFMEWVNTIIPEKFDKKALPYDEERLIIPFVDKQKNLIAFQGRKIKTNNNNVKYITIKLESDKHAVFG